MEVIERDIEEFKTFIFPEYQKISCDISAQSTAVLKNSKRLLTALDKQGEIWHEEIETIIQKLKSYLVEPCDYFGFRGPIHPPHT
uniref:Uncharacterized protein n=1 Tax=Magallana gigas TaxID=29159 RepID=K1PYL4_MAGGI